MTEVVICDKCFGFGKIDKDELINYHKGEYDSWEVDCDKCGGTGRLIKETKISYRKLTKKELKLKKR